MVKDHIYPSKLRAGDEIRVIAPAKSLAIISPNVRAIAEQRFSALGLKITFGQHVEEADDFQSSSVAARVDDIHAAFSDPRVKGVVAVIGGYNSNQLLRYIDWKIIAKHPKIFCGYSDISILNNAILSKTDLVTYSGPAYSTFGQELYFDYTLESFRQCLFNDAPMTLRPSQEWTDDAWYQDQHHRIPMENPGYITLNGGQAKGHIIGANLCTFNLLQGTEYFPDFTDSILFLEDDEESQPHHFDRDLQSLIHQPYFSKVRGLVIGRFQKSSRMENDVLRKIIKSKKELDNLPVIANVDFGHTSPIITFPIGGECSVDADRAAIVINKH